MFKCGPLLFDLNCRHMIDDVSNDSLEKNNFGGV